MSYDSGGMTSKSAQVTTAWRVGVAVKLVHVTIAWRIVPSTISAQVIFALFAIYYLNKKTYP